MNVILLTTLTQLAGLRRPWNGLAEHAPFCSWDWLESWWRFYAESEVADSQQRELYCLAVFDAAGELAGLAPWYLERSAPLGRVLRFLGSGSICTDYLTVLCRPGCEDQVTTALADALCGPEECPRAMRCRDWDLIELGAVDPQDATVGMLLEKLSARDNAVHQRRGANCWRIALPQTWDDYLSMVSHSHRKQLRRLERRLDDAGRLSLHEARTHAELFEGLELLVRLHRKRRRSLGEAGCFDDPQFMGFHTAAALRLFDRGKLRLAWLELDGRPVAAEYQILGDEVVYAYQSGIEPEALQHEPGRLIMMATLKQAIAEGRRGFDFLRGDESYKPHWRAQPRQMLEIRVAPATSVSRLRHKLWKSSDTMKHWIKTGLTLSGLRS